MNRVTGWLREFLGWYGPAVCTALMIYITGCTQTPPDNQPIHRQKSYPYKGGPGDEDVNT
ncbi:MAG: hypothetical protein GXY33_05500 [Phycisphaerae bacterium]|nr:hypothetical protein [Phycisphaerae bacterium]